jgi:predicted RNA binding protein YcfA (HicA-like mRNA interferase family)
MAGARTRAVVSFGSFAPAPTPRRTLLAGRATMWPVDRRELRRRLSQRPRDVRFEEIDRLLRLSGWRLNNVRGSHHVYRSPQGNHLSIPRAGGIVKVAYVRMVLAETKEDGDD